MARRRRLLSIGLVATFAAAAGTAWAVTQGNDFHPEGPMAPTGKLAHGTAPSGAGYSVSRIDAAAVGESRAGAICTQITTPAGGTQGCDPVPDADGRIHGQAWRPSMAQLGTDRFFTALAPRGVTAMEVRMKGETKATRSQSIDVGSVGELLMVVVDGPPVTSDPASSPDYEVRLLGANGETVREITMRY